MPSILLIEDQDDIRFVFEMALTKQGYQVDAHSNGGSALEAINEALPDIAVVDSGLPGMSGLDVGRHIRSRETGDHKVILALFTGSDSLKLQQQSQEAGFDLMIKKPISVIEFCNQLDQLNRERR